MIDLTEPLTRACEIWHRVDDENTVSGKIEYIPGKGVKIQILDVSNFVRGETDFLHGIMETGDKFTAIDVIVPTTTGIVMRNGYTSYPATIHAKSLLIGAHIIKEDFVQRCKFSFHGMQEIFFPEYNSREFPLTQEPLCELETEFGILSVRTFASFKSLPADLSDVIQPLRSKDIALFNQELSEFSKKHSEHGFGIREKFGFLFRLDADPKINHERLFECIESVGDLISLLLNSPLLTASVEILLKRCDDEYVRCELLPSFIMNQSTYEKALKITKNHNLPIRFSDFDIEYVLANWFQYKENFKLITSLVRHDIGTASTHQLYSTIMMLAVHLEQISDSESIPMNQKYQYPIDTYASINVHNQISRVLSKHSREDLGRTIGHIRDELTHLMRPKVLLLAMSNRELMLLSELLEITIISWILQTKLGVGVEACHEYQNTLYPDNSDE